MSFAERVGQFAGNLVARRKEAIEARHNSGIEEIWREDEEAYEGIDDANRKAALEKGQTLGHSAGWTRTQSVAIQTKATAYTNITRPYVDAAAARVADMLVPTDELPFAVMPTAKADKTYLVELMLRMAGAAPSPEQQAQVAAAYEQAQAEAAERASAAQIQIKDWMEEGKWHGEAREVIHSAALVGTGILKGPFPERRNLPAAVAAAIDSMPVEMQMQLLYRPNSAHISVWDLYPDGSCGTDIQNGEYVFERMRTTRRRLRDLRSDPNYSAKAIEACLEEGPLTKEGKARYEGAMLQKRSGAFELWVYTGPVPEDLLAEEALDEIGEIEQADWPVAEMDINELGETRLAQAVICNGRIIKVMPLPGGVERFPYWVLRWQKRRDHWAGIGVARQIETPQRALAATVRNMLDNAALAGGPILVLFKDLFEPVHGGYEIAPRKVYHALADASPEGIAAVRNAITTIDIPSKMEEMLAMVRFFLQMAEESTGLPLLLQGQSTSQTPQTVGGIQLMTNAATTVLRRLARAFDDEITEPNVSAYYEWIREHGPESAQGDIKIRARGSSVLVERELQTQALVQLLQLALNPAYGLSPRGLAKQYVEGQRFVYRDVAMGDEEYQQAMAAAQQPDPKLEVERERIANQRYLGELQARTQAAGQARQADVAMQRVVADMTKADRDRLMKAVELVTQREAEIEAQRVESETRVAEALLEPEKANV